MVTETIPNKKKYKEAKWLSEEALQIAKERSEVEGKSERKRYTQLNAEFQRRARRDKKGFLSAQCKEIEENNKMVSPFYLHIGDTKIPLLCKDGHNKVQKWQGPKGGRRD